MFKYLFLLCALLAFPAQAGTIDFEGLGDQAVAGTIITGDNAVTFSCGATSSNGNCFTFHYGGVVTSFAPDDTPATGFGSGTDLGFVGLTDAFTGPSVDTAFDYFFQFANPITQLGFDIIDAEGVGNIFTISLFRNADFTDLIGSGSFSPSGGGPDGSVNVVNAILSSGAALSARFGDVVRDGGVAIDNIRFTTAVPAPPAIAIMALALLSLAGSRRRGV